MKTFCNFEPQIWLEIITSRDAKSACFKGSRTSCREIIFGIFWPNFGQKRSHHVMDASCRYNMPKRKLKLRCSFRNAALQKLHCNIGFSAMRKSFGPKAALQQTKKCTATSKKLRCRKVALSCRFRAPTFRHPRFGPADGFSGGPFREPRPPEGPKIEKDSFSLDRLKKPWSAQRAPFQRAPVEKQILVKF